ncbi:MAG: DUF3467 domain-containing protein [Actinomycetales bacterium]|jgi:hypothetical protein|nr:DUF3467 domain-containing protein [Actinomycetales bacterium]
MSEPSRQVPVRFQVEVPPDVEAGVPAEFANVWHTRTSFVLDFAVPKGPPQVLDDEAGRRAVITAKVVSRVRIPPQQAFEIARALTQQLDMWEKETGAGRPQPPSSPPAPPA